MVTRKNPEVRKMCSAISEQNSDSSSCQEICTDNSTFKAIGLRRKLAQHSLGSNAAEVNNNHKHNLDYDNNILPFNSENEFGEHPNLSESQVREETMTSGEVVYEQQEYETVLVEPDGGWGWWVLFGSMIVNILIPGTVKSFGVLFIEFLEVFETSPSAAAWIPAISYFLYSSTGPFAGALALRFSYRTVTIVGGLLTASGLCLSYFATSLGFLYVSYGVIGGLGAGLAYPNGVFIVGQYFNKKRGLANGLCTSGSALGAVLVPPFLRFLLEEYGYRYAILIMGLLLLNVCLAALFYDPVEKHLKKELIPTMVTTNPNSCTQNRQTLGYSRSDSMSIQPSNSSSKCRINLSATQEDQEETSDSPIRRSDWSFYKGLPSSRQRLMMSMEQGHQHVNQNLDRSSLPASGTQMGLTRKISIASNSSFHYVTTIHHGSVLMAMQYDKHLPRFDSTLPVESAGGTCWDLFHSLSMKCLQKIGICKKQVEVIEDEIPEETKSSWNPFDFKLLKDGFFIIMLLSAAMSTVGYTNFLILLPAYALGMGFDKSKSSLLLSFVAAFDFLGRIGGASLSDLKFIPRFWFFVLGIFGSGLTLVLLPLATKYWILATFCAIFGLWSGTYIGVTAVILAENLGPENLGSSYGITLFINGILQLLGPPICGAAYEGLGKYEPIFVALGLILMFGASIWLLVPVIENQKAMKLFRQQGAERISSQNYATTYEDRS